MDLYRKVGTFLFLSVMAVCLTTAAANAQNISRGSFTLQHDTQWGKTTLPKGNYNYEVRETGMLGAMVTITSAGNSSRQVRMMGLQRAPEGSLKGATSMLIVSQVANSDAIRGIYMADSGMEYTFPVHAKGKAVMAQDSKQAAEREVTLRIPVRSAGK